MRRAAGEVIEADADAAFRLLEKYDVETRRDIDALDANLEQLKRTNGVEVFGLNEAMIQSQIALAGTDLSLRSVDQAILAAVLVRAQELNGPERAPADSAKRIPISSRGRPMAIRVIRSRGCTTRRTSGFWVIF